MQGLVRKDGRSECLGRTLLIEITILHAAMRQNATQVLRETAMVYKVDVDAIGLKVKQDFAAKEKAKLSRGRAKEFAPKYQLRNGFVHHCSEHDRAPLRNILHDRIVARTFCLSTNPPRLSSPEFFAQIPLQDLA
jgi:hypothetical protein